MLFKDTNIVVEDGTAKKSEGNEKGENYKFERSNAAALDPNDPGPPPMFIMMPSREALHRMIVRSTHYKKVEDMDF